MEDKGKKLMAFHALSLRSLLDMANEVGIQKEDIVQIVREENGYFLLYYK